MTPTTATQIHQKLTTDTAYAATFGVELAALVAKLPEAKAKTTELPAIYMNLLQYKEDAKELLVREKFDAVARVCEKSTTYLAGLTVNPVSAQKEYADTVSKVGIYLKAYNLFDAKAELPANAQQAVQDAKAVFSAHKGAKATSEFNKNKIQEVTAATRTLATTADKYKPKA